MTPWLGQPGFRFPGSMTLCLGMSRAHPRCHGCTVTSKGRIKPTCIDRDTPTMHHHAHSGENAPQRRAGMQEDPTVRIALTHASSNQMGSHITSDCCVQRPCSAKLYALRTGRHGGQREQRLSRPSHDPLKKNMQIGISYGGAYLGQSRATSWVCLSKKLQAQ